MNAAVSLLRPAPTNAATHPQLTDALRATVGAKSAAALALLREAFAEFGPLRSTCRRRRRWCRSRRARRPRSSADPT